MNFRGAFLLVLLPLIAGCAPRLDMATAQASYSALKPTVASYDAMNFTPLSYPSVMPSSVTVADPAFDFGKDGTSYFKAYELPQRDAPYQVAVSMGKFAYGCMPCSTGLFVARVTLLDAAKKPVAVEMKGPVYYDATSTRWRQDWFDVTPAMNARYLIIHTTRDDIARGDDEDRSRGASVAPVGGLFIPIPGGQTVVHADGSPIGPISVALRPVTATPGE